MASPSELERSGWAGVAEAAGRQTAAAALDTAEEVRGQVWRAGGSQNAAAGRAARQSVNQGFIRNQEPSAQFTPKAKKSDIRLKMGWENKNWMFLLLPPPRRELCEERKSSSEREEKMRMELEAMGVRLEEKKKRCAELLQEVPRLPPQNAAS